LFLGVTEQLKLVDFILQCNCMSVLLGQNCTRSPPCASLDVV